MYKKRPLLFSLPLFIAGLAGGLSGCTSVAYYGQSMVGHSKLMLARQPVRKLIPIVDEPLKAQLKLSQQLRLFATQELGLPDSKSYSSYVALTREYPVWNVVAAPKFSLDAKRWCYPVIGCASYRGYFKQAAAHRYAKRLRRQGYETVVGGASAYSTLGWFSDPLLPSMMRYGDIGLAETLFHELAHQQLYINGDSDFNEAFATVVGEVGARRWLASERPEQRERYQQNLLARDQFYALIESTKLSLAQAYSVYTNELDKQRAKTLILERLENDYNLLKTEQWGGQPMFDAWFDKEVNNARLAAFSTYRKRVPKLMQLLSLCDDNLVSFYRVLATAVKVDGSVQTPVNCR